MGQELSHEELVESAIQKITGQEDDSTEMDIADREDDNVEEAGPSLTERLAALAVAASEIGKHFGLSSAGLKEIRRVQAQLRLEKQNLMKQRTIESFFRPKPLICINIHTQRVCIAKTNHTSCEPGMAN